MFPNQPVTSLYKFVTTPTVSFHKALKNLTTFFHASCADLISPLTKALNLALCLYSSTKATVTAAIALTIRINMFAFIDAFSIFSAVLVNPNDLVKPAKPVSRLLIPLNIFVLAKVAINTVPRACIAPLWLAIVFNIPETEFNGSLAFLLFPVRSLNTFEMSLRVSLKVFQMPSANALAIDSTLPVIEEISF
ncbi:hypothetical protein FD00_GL001749 [Liquorilactobacillus mali KCTC 3596 = DSM 20444]|uniref:Uncharacterized protein n=1 Tax=Liquorilactobacillus mali KCTC 3596 = DSM 20444 TaxID=1046596 RepID=A0A0R2DY70_9LACO|nr:hypothetical protein FD00_GL001749 [Liquorilactobacillus mali KCTC 3596 = DSM 20444]